MVGFLRLQEEYSERFSNSIQGKGIRIMTITSCDNWHGNRYQLLGWQVTQKRPCIYNWLILPCIKSPNSYKTSACILHGKCDHQKWWSGGPFMCLWTKCSRRDERQTGILFHVYLSASLVFQFINQLSVKCLLQDATASFYIRVLINRLVFVVHY
jgi:hypothetical protein